MRLTSIIKTVLLGGAIALLTVGCSSKDPMAEHNKRIIKEYSNAPAWVFMPNMKNEICEIDSDFRMKSAVRKAVAKLSLGLETDGDEVVMTDIWRSDNLRYYVRMCWKRSLAEHKKR